MCQSQKIDTITETDTISYFKIFKAMGMIQKAVTLVLKSERNGQLLFACQKSLQRQKQER